MTDREKAIVSAYTGITMLSGEKFQIFHKYIEDILGRPVYTHELALETIWQQIKEKSKDDFIEICKREDGWIPVSERLPEKSTWVLVTCKNPDGYIFLDIKLINQYTELWDGDEDFIGTVLA